MSDGAAAIVVGHGDLAAGLVSAVDQITGCGARFVPVSNSGLGTAELEQKLRELVERTGARVIFTDLPAGSCNFAACHLLKERDDVVVVTGANLPALLFFAMHGELPAREAAEKSIERGAQSLRVLPGR